MAVYVTSFHSRPSDVLTQRYIRRLPGASLATHSVIMTKRASFDNQDGSRNIHDYRILYNLKQHMLPVAC